MADFNPIFEIDASKIMAKLHLAGQQAVPNSAVINTGIKNNDPKATPESPGKVEFAFSKSGEYQLAIIRLVQYRIPIDLKLNNKIVEADKVLQQTLKQPSLFDEKAQEEAAKNKEKEDKDNKKETNKEENKEEKNNETDKTDKNAEKKKEEENAKKPLTAKVNDSVEVMSFLDYITEAGEEASADSAESAENKKTIEECYKKILVELESYTTAKSSEKPPKEAEGSRNMKMENMFEKNGYKHDNDPAKFVETWKKFNECLKAENEHRIAYKKAMLDDLNGGAMNDIKDYFTTFAGKDNQAKINQNKIAQVVLDLDGETYKDPTSFKAIKDGKIEIKDMLVQSEKQEKEMAKTEPNFLFKRSIGCAVGYKVDIE